MSGVQTFYWFDYETFGRSPRWDRPSQFAGRRTDLELRPIGEPDVFYCCLPDDYLPEPGACRVTGISPDTVTREGVPEADFIKRAVGQLGFPGTVSVGYNSIRFDDEFTRYTLFRNLADPYAQEWRDGASRWDLLDVMRLTRALRPDGIVWPSGDDGQPVNTLGALASANGIEHVNAHDALSDVEATIGLARVLKQRQPKLFAWLFEHRGKLAAATLLNVRERQPVLLSCNRVPRERHHLAAVLPLCRAPDNANAVIVADLDTLPDELDGLDAATLRERLFTRTEGVRRIGLYTVKLNACPVLAPLATLRRKDADRLEMDIEAIAGSHKRWTARLSGTDGEHLLARICEAVQRQGFSDDGDVDGSLYAGGFLSSSDRRQLDALRELTPEALASARPTFEDARLGTLLFRYRARNWPATLTAVETTEWHEAIRERLTRDDADWLSLPAFEQAMQDADWTASEAPLRASLDRHVRALSERVGLYRHSAR